MLKKLIVLASIFLLLLTAACSSQTASASGSASGSTDLSTVADSTKLSVDDKLGVGILSLAGTSYSITTDQATTLLPLWQAVLALGSDKSSSSTEITALYTQIKGTLTQDQLTQIEQLTWTQDDLASLLQQHSAQTAQASTSTKSSTSSTSSSTTASSGGGQPQDMGGGPGGGGMMPSDGGIMMGDTTGMTAQSTTTTTQQSLIASQASASTTVDLNVLFANAVINLLQQQVSA